jgi:dTDP-3-amino-3,4,6-trideoxy-alpha-D-glucose transaminase
MASAVSVRRPAAVRFVALDRQHERLESDLQAAFMRLLGSSAFTLGAEVEQFEQEFADYCDVSHCVGVSSGTSALMLMLKAHGIGPGDEVIVPGHTFIASALAIAHVGATPVLCDVDEGTGLIDPDAARAAVGPNTAAVLAVHLYGQTCDMAAINEFAEPNGLLVFEDAAQAHGARFRGERVGSLGSAAAFSFYPTKNLGALGDGGAVCTDDEDIAARVRRLRNLGQKAKGEHVELGYNERLDGLQAALLRVKLEYLDEWNDDRRSHAARYRGLLPAEARLLEERADSPCIYHLYPARFEDRDAVGAVLREQGIDSAVHYAPAIHGHQTWNEYPIHHGELPVSEAWAAQELSLPMHPDLRPDEIERVAAAVADAVS